MQNSDTAYRKLGVLWIVYGVVCFVKVAWILVNEPALTVMWGTLLSRVPNPYPWISSFHFGLLVAITVLIVAGVFSFLAAVALLAGSRSGRNLGLVAGFLGLITGPLGVLLGAYTLLALFPRGAGTPAEA
jgi:hypothetical protein